MDTFALRSYTTKSKSRNYEDDSRKVDQIRTLERSAKSLLTGLLTLNAKIALVEACVQMLRFIEAVGVEVTPLSVLSM